MMSRVLLHRLVVRQRRHCSSSSEKQKSYIAENLDSLWGLAKFGAFLHLFHEYFLDISMCCGPSMLPTLSASGDIVLMERISPRLGKIKVGDVVISKSPTEAGQTVCKRVAATEGESVGGGAVVPRGHVWLLGDNPNNSTDSRYYGAVPAAMIQGRVWCRIYPFSRIKAL